MKAVIEERGDHFVVTRGGEVMREFSTLREAEEYQRNAAVTVTLSIDSGILGQKSTIK